MSVIDKGAKHIIEILEQNGYEGHIVGGCVRDMLLGKSPKDWDITTDAKPEEVKKIFQKTIDTGIEHGTVTVRINKVSYEVTTYRIDGEYIDSRRPQQVFYTQSLKEDLARRDFTINAMASDGGEVIDYFNGKGDLKEKLIRCVGEADLRFEEDALRIMRGVRFAAQLGFHIEKETFEAMKRKRELLRKISGERIRDEILKILLSERASYGFELMKEAGIIDIVLPEMVPMIGFDQKNINHDKDVYYHTMAVIDAAEPEIVPRLAALLHDIGKPNVFSLDESGIGHFYNHEKISEEIGREIMRRLKLDNKTIGLVSLLIREHMNFSNNMKHSKSIKRFMERVGEENLELLFRFKKADIRGTANPENIERVEKIREKCQEVLERNEPFSIKDLKVTGHDMMDLGYKGKEIGVILEKLLEMVIDHPQENVREKLLEFAGRK